MNREREIPGRLLAAAWVAPMSSPIIRDGAVVISGGRASKIEFVGSITAARKAHSDAQIIELGSSIILPGLVNAHTHLELSDFAAGEPPKGGFTEWLQGMIVRPRLADEELKIAVQSAVANGIKQCLRFGVTTVGDISRQCHVSRPILKGSPVRAISYGEVQALAKRRGFLEERLEIAADRSEEADRLKIGITPHAPYSIEENGYRRCLEVARNGHLPLATHLAETPGEEPFLRNHSGPLRDLWDKLLPWDDKVPTFAGGPIRFAKAIGLLDYPTLLAHVNYSDDAELALLAAGRASVVYCPRTHAYFGHPPHRWREMLDRGINVAVGTDSCASSPDLNLVDDLRLIHRLAPDFPSADLWGMATTRAAAAIGLADHAGALIPGRDADLVAFNVSTDEPLLEVLRSDCLPRQVWGGD
jgi:cytosine/adenosine deaminase-related metal-dependent hydrolase